MGIQRTPTPLRVLILHRVLLPRQGIIAPRKCNTSSTEPTCRTLSRIGVSTVVASRTRRSLSSSRSPSRSLQLRGRAFWREVRSPYSSRNLSLHIDHTTQVACVISEQVLKCGARLSDSSPCCGNPNNPVLHSLHALG